MDGFIIEKHGHVALLQLTAAEKRNLLTPDIALQIAAASEQAGFNNLRRSGLKKVMQGITSLQEINRVTSE